MADIPDVWHYAPRSPGINAGQNFTSGYQAGLRGRELELEAQRLAEAGSRHEQELNLRKEALAQDATQHSKTLQLQRAKIQQEEEENDQKIKMLYGANIVFDPVGNVDFAASEAAKKKELERNAAGHALALNEGFEFGWNLNVDPSVRNSIGYQAGMGEVAKLKGVESIRAKTVDEANAVRNLRAEADRLSRENIAKENRLSREDIAEANRKERAARTPVGEAVGPVIKDGILVFHSGGGRYRSVTDDERREYKRTHPVAVSTNAPDGVLNFYRKPGGGWEKR